MNYKNEIYFYLMLCILNQIILIIKFIRKDPSNIIKTIVEYLIPIYQIIFSA